MRSRFVALGLLAFPIAASYGCGAGAPGNGSHGSTSSDSCGCDDSSEDAGYGSSGGGHKGYDAGKPPRDDSGTLAGDDEGDGGDDAGHPSGPDGGSPAPGSDGGNAPPGDDTSDSGSPAPGSDGGSPPPGDDASDSGNPGTPGSDGGNAPPGDDTSDSGTPGGDAGTSDSGNPPPPPVDAAPPSCNLAAQFGGQGVAASASGLIGLDLGDTGFFSLTATPIHVTNTAVSATVPGTVDLQTLFASLDGAGATVHALAQTAAAQVQASVAGITLPIVPTNLVTATVIESESFASCNGSQPSVSGATTIANLKVAGIPILVDGSANEKISVAGIASIVINEQIPSTSGSLGSMVTNAIHVKLLGSTQEIVISSAAAKINCSCVE